MPAFATYNPLPRSSQTPIRRPLSANPTHIQWRARPRFSLAAPPPNKSFKNRSVIALRGLSNLGGVTILHELAARVALPTALSTFVQADTQLLLGGWIGVWTAASLAERLRDETLSRIRESRHLPDRWDAAFIYTPDIVGDEVIDAVAWLYAFDELEGV